MFILSSKSVYNFQGDFYKKSSFIFILKSAIIKEKELFKSLIEISEKLFVPSPMKQVIDLYKKEKIELVGDKIKNFQDILFEFK